MKNLFKEIIAIGDIHGRHYWEEIVERHIDAHLVFLGDYADPYERMERSDVLQNLKNIVTLKKEHPEQVTLLLGNHDLHYFVPNFPKGSRYDYFLAEDLRQLFTTERALFSYAYEYGNIIFTHAGISQSWLDLCWKKPLSSSIASTLNQPEMMGDKGASLYTCGPARMGLDPAGGIFWADEDELMALPKGWIQVVGHNQMKRIRHIHSQKADAKELADLLICDCLGKQRYLQIEFNNECTANFYEVNLKDKSRKIVFSTQIKSTNTGDSFASQV